MRDLRAIIGENILELRKKSGFTQIELAEKLNYSDKAVSKWENGDSLPDVGVLCDIAEIFSVSIDYLTKADHSEDTQMLEFHLQQKKHFHKVITLISCSLVWFIATTVFVVLYFLFGNDFRSWMSFLYAVPVSLIVLLIFNSIWGARRYNYLIVSILMWSILICFYLTLLQYNIWHVFSIGLPAQLIIFLSSRLHK